MKEKLVGKLQTCGFSTLEIVIALALLLVVISGAVSASMASEYWALTAETASEGLSLAKTAIEQLRTEAAVDFLHASTSLVQLVDDSCIAGGLCYGVQRIVTDISSCSKFAEARVTWKIASRYPTSTVQLYTNVTNNAEIIASGGDCLLATPAGDWRSGALAVAQSVSLAPSGITGIDVLQKRIYLTSTQSPPLRIFSVPTTTAGQSYLLGSSSGNGIRLNAVDAVRDVSTGRIYAYATVHASTTQLVVFEVTDATHPVVVNSQTLSGVVPTGSFPEGWRVAAYGNRLYVTTRETAGPELHIFNSNQPAQPTEIPSAAFELNRTVNDMAVRDQMVNGSVHRLLFLASSAGLKEFAIIDVTNDTPTELLAIDLPGSIDARSLALVGSRVFVGRASNAFGPELYQFAVTSLLRGETASLATAEVGADVLSLRVSGDSVFLGTGKTGEEFQVWSSDPASWDATRVNSGRLAKASVPHLAPLGIDMTERAVVAATQSLSQPEQITFMTP